MQVERARGWIDGHRDVFLDALRVYLGVALMAKGIAFARDHASLVLLTEKSSLAWVQSMASQYVVPVHVFGGFLLAIGLVSRTAALFNIPILLGAIFFVHGREGLFATGGGLELDLLVLFLLLVFAVVGSGRVSIDRYLETHSSRGKAPFGRPSLTG